MSNRSLSEETGWLFAALQTICTGGPVTTCTLVCPAGAVTRLAGVPCRAPKQTMSCTRAAASIAGIDTASLEDVVHDTKRQRTNAQRCSTASDQTVVTSADGIRTGTNDASAAQHEQRTPRGGFEGHVEAAVVHAETSPAVLQPARPESDRCAMQPRAFYGLPHRSSGQHGGRQTAIELRVHSFLQVVARRDSFFIHPSKTW